MESAKRSLSARIRENGFRKQLKQDARGGGGNRREGGLKREAESSLIRNNYR